MPGHLKSGEGDPHDPCPDDASVVEAALQLGVAFMTKDALLALIAERRDDDPAAVEAAVREIKHRNRRVE